MTAFFARFRERLKRARRRGFAPPTAEGAFFAVTLAVVGAVLSTGCEEMLMGTMIREEYGNGLAVEYWRGSKDIEKIFLNEAFFANGLARASIRTPSDVIDIPNRRPMREYLLEKGFTESGDKKSLSFHSEDAEIVVHLDSDRTTAVDVVGKKIPMTVQIFIGTDGKMVRCPNSPDAVRKIFGAPVNVYSYKCL